MTPSSKSPVRNVQRSPSMTSRTGGSWHTSIHARQLKFGTHVNNYISWLSMMSGMTPSSKYPVRNHEHPPSITSRTGGSWHMLESWDLTHKSIITYHDDPLCQKIPHPPSILSGTIQVFQVWFQWRLDLDTLLFMIESWNLAHNSIITYHDDPWCQQWPHLASIQSRTINVLKV